MSGNKYTVAVLMGGASAEREVSANSARQICAALQQVGHTTHAIELDAVCPKKLMELQPDVVFPALHGPPGEDGTVQGFLEMLGLPYVGSDVHGSALAMDKAVAKHIFRHHGLPVADDILISADEQDLPARADEIVQRLGPAVVIKPLNQGSAIGVTPLPNGGDVTAALSAALVYGDCLVEPFVMGKEITVGVLQSAEGLIPHPVIEIITGSEEWYDYDNRYTPGFSEHLMPAPLSESLSEQLQEIALAAHRVLGLSDLSRADFIVTDDDDITLLEVNTLPGMTPTSLYPEGANWLGYEFDALVDHLVKLAVARGPRSEIRASSSS
jgi:D-alanine-D-alanine ligase